MCLVRCQLFNRSLVVAAAWLMFARWACPAVGIWAAATGCYVVWVLLEAGFQAHETVGAVIGLPPLQGNCLW